jgi:Zierdtviridae exonuclease
MHEHQDRSAFPGWLIRGRVTLSLGRVLPDNSPPGPGHEWGRRKLTNDVPLLTTSEIKSFDRCPQQWWWGYRSGLRGKSKPADALWFGTGIHYALAEWYDEGFNRGPQPADTFYRWVGDEVREIKANLTDRDREWFEEPAYYDAGDLGIAMLDAYLDQYGEDEDWEVIAVEQAFEVELVRNGETIAIFAGCVDGAFIDHSDGNAYLLENKSAGAIKTAHLPLDMQAGNYFAAGTTVLRHQGVIGPKDTLYGIMYNFLRKSMPDERPRNARGAALNKDGRISKRQPPKMFHREPVDRKPREVGAILQRITDKAMLMNEYRSGRMPVTKNITDMCPYCPFFNMCLLHEKGGNAWRHFRDQQFIVTDPYHEQLNKGKSASE